MAKNILVVSCDVRETRAALIEDGIIAELHIERSGADASTVGNVYVGKVTRVLPGLQAAFIDIGQERAAFLHVEDLIRPDDFDAYLAGGRKHARGEARVVEAEVPPVEEDEDGADDDEAPITAVSAAAEAGAPAAPGAAASHSSNVELELGSEAALLEGATDDSSADVGALAAQADDDLDEAPDSDEAAVSPEPLQADGDDGDDGDDRGSDADLDPADDVADDLDRGDGDDAADEAEGPTLTSAPIDGFPEDLPGFTISDPGEPVPRAPAPARTADRGRGRRRGRGRSGDRPGGDGGGGGGRDRGRSGGGGGGTSDRGDRGKHGRRPGPSAQPAPNRISKSTPIREVVREGQEIIVQVTKDPISTKGARCSSHISLPGRYVVYLPTVEHVGISKRIGSEKERARLREAIDGMKPPSGGLIVRTVAEGLTKKQLKQDVGYLVRLWGEIAKKKETVGKAPAILMNELDLVLKVARDLFTDEVAQVVVDDKNQYDRLCRFVEMFAPDRVKDVVYYSEEEPIFDAYGIEDEIGRALSRKVPLPSGGHLVIDQAEALTAIDVNTGRFVGKGSKDMEETVLKTNLEAVHEIAYQLRFRNIGGLIILDLIDMERSSNREKVRRTLEDLLQKDKAKTTLNRISDLGLIEMTRKRTRESLGRMLHEPCFYCDGTGQLMSKETIAFEILREIRRKRADLPGYSVVVNAHPAVCLLYTSPSPRDRTRSRMPSSA